MKVKLKSEMKIRNHVARSPLLKKGGMFMNEQAKVVHRRERKQAKQQLRHLNWED